VKLVNNVTIVQCCLSEKVFLSGMNTSKMVMRTQIMMTEVVIQHHIEQMKTLK